MKKILIIDDSVHILNQISTALKLEGNKYKVKHAVNGVNGLEIARKFQPDLILLDIMLPGLNGIEICKALKSDKKYRSIPIILMTVLDKSEEVVRGLSAGANDYVSKPFKLREILARVKTHLKVKEICDSKNKAERKARVKAETELKSRENFFQIIMQSMGEGIFVLDRKFRIQMANRFLLKMLKREEKEAVGEHCYRLIYKREKRCVKCPPAETFKTGKPTFREQSNIRGYEKVCANTTFFPIFESNGQVNQVVGKVVDVSKQKKTEASLREREQQTKLFALATSDMLWNWDIINNTIERSIGFEKVFGYTRKEIIPDIDWWIERLHPNDQKRVLSAYQDAVDKGENSCSYEYRFRCRGGKYAVIDDRAYIIRDKKGMHVRSLGAMTDITKRKQAEDEKEKMQIQLLHSEKLKSVGQLAGGIAHEYNNALMVIMGFGEVIHAGMNENDPLRSKVEQIISISKKTAKFTGNLLALSREQAMSITTVKLGKIVENIRKLTEIMLDEDIEFIIKQGERDLFIKVDSGLIEQVLMNLITNSKDAMRGVGQITIQTKRAQISEEFIKKEGFGKCGNYALLSFTDTGKGMDNNTAKKAFKPFFTTKDVGKGTGLGLSTVYGIVKQHGGFIGLYSKPGEGTTFKIYFPLNDADEINNSNNNNALQPPKENETILLAEDNEDIRNMIGEELRKLGYKVIEAVDGKDAVKLFKKNKNDIQLVLLDVIMPKQNGNVAFEKIKKEKPEVKSIFMSGYSEDILHNKGIFSKDIHYITKPISIFKLLNIVREALDQ